MALTSEIFYFFKSEGNHKLTWKERKAILKYVFKNRNELAGKHFDENLISNCRSTPARLAASLYQYKRQARTQNRLKLLEFI